MKAIRVVYGIFATALLAGACGGGDGDGNGNHPEGGNADKLDPPANIDVKVCSSVATEEYASNPACAECCSANAYRGSTSHKGLCICGNERDNAGETACGGQTGSGDLCSTCCADTGFGSGGTDASCSCSQRFDRQICASNLEGPEPSDICRVCCLNNGYLGMAYTNLGTPECNCTGG